MCVRHHINIARSPLNVLILSTVTGTIMTVISPIDDSEFNPPSEVESSKGKGVFRPRSFSLPAGVIAGTLIGLLIVGTHDRQITQPNNPVAAKITFSNVDDLSTDDIQALIMKALSRLAEQQGLTADFLAKSSQDPKELGAYSRKDVDQGVRNIQRLLPSVRDWTLEALREATVAYDLHPREWPRVTRLVYRVRKVIRRHDLQSMAAVSDNRLSEILVDPAYAPYLKSDDEAVFVLAHELTHVAARSNELHRFIEGVAAKATRAAQVEPTEGQREDLACDLIGEMVLKRFIALTPTSESMSVRISSVVGYESPAQRFTRAWEDFCASYNGDPGDDDHLTQYQTIRALLALDPELKSMCQSSAISIPSSR